MSIASSARQEHDAPMVPKSPLDDPETAAYAWARYRRLMRLMLFITIGVVLVAIALLYDGESSASVFFYIATAVGIGVTMLLTSALMGLVFLSNGTGHDETVTDLMKDDEETPNA